MGQVAVRARGLDDSGPDADPAVITGYKAARNRPLTRGQKLSNKTLAAVRAPVEHGFAHLKIWRVLGIVRTDGDIDDTEGFTDASLTQQERRELLRHRCLLRTPVNSAELAATSRWQEGP